MPQAEPIRFYQPEDAAATLLALQNIKRASTPPYDRAVPTPQGYVSEDEATRWLNALEQAGWHNINEPGVSPEIRREAIDFYLTQRPANDFDPNLISPAFLLAAAKEVLGDTTSPQSNIANFPPSIANDFRKSGDGVVKPDRSDTDTDSDDDDDKVSSLSTAEEADLVFLAAADQATVPPLSLNKQGSLIKAAAIEAPKESKGLRDLFRGVSKFVGTLTVQSALDTTLGALLPHATPLRPVVAAFLHVVAAFRNAGARP